MPWDASKRHLEALLTTSKVGGMSFFSCSSLVFPRVCSPTWKEGRKEKEEREGGGERKIRGRRREREEEEGRAGVI